MHPANQLGGDSGAESLSAAPAWPVVPVVVVERGLGTLTTYLTMHPVLSARDCLCIIRGIVHGLAYLHSLKPYGVIHFDVKPGRSRR